MGTSMGTAASGTFSTNEKLHKMLHKSGETNGDRVWSFPLYDDIRLNTKAADLGNHNIVKGGNILFAPPAPVDFMHIDLSGTVIAIANKLFPTKYLREGYATGRPVRTLVDYFVQLNEAKNL